MSWVAKADLNMDVQAILGHHAIAGRKSVITYSREIQAGPLRHLIAVLSRVRSGAFHPDRTRSGMVTEARASSDESRWYHAVSTEFGSWDKVADDVGSGGQASGDIPAFPPEPPSCPMSPEPQVVDQASGEDELGELPPIPSSQQSACASEDGSDVSSSDSDSSSTSSSIDGSDDEKVQEAGEHACDLGVKKSLDGCPMFRHVRTKTIHVGPLGSAWTRFLCGRPKTKEHVEMRSAVSVSDWMCKQCSMGKGIQDTSGLNEALDRVLKRRVDS